VTATPHGHGSKPASPERPDSRGTSTPESKERQPASQNSRLVGSSSPLSRRDVPNGLSNGKTGKHCEGLDPMGIDPAVLTAAGHPPSETRTLIRAFKRIMGEEIFAAEFLSINRHKHIRAYCKTCVENEAEVRRCATFWCPFWPYRMGKNPHSPRLGKPLPHLNRET
jgi:hypothetical protein